MAQTQAPAVGAVRGFRVAPVARKSARSSLRTWYAEGLESKVERAVLDGRVDAAKAAEFHRLMEQLLEIDPRQG
jgi:hypothetical protein